jgi:choline dehydrogenase-like flavoprotein
MSGTQPLYEGLSFRRLFQFGILHLPWAQETGNLTIRPHSVVHSIIYDEKKGKAAGVRIIDANTKETTDFFARIIFVNASALNSTLVLLNSKSTRFPNGLGNDNGLLGTHVAFHNYRASVGGDLDGFDDKYYSEEIQRNLYWPITEPQKTGNRLRRGLYNVYGSLQNAMGK